MRESRYNVWADAGGSAYVFNGVSGALLGLAAADYHAVRRLLSGGGTQGCRPNVLARLVEGWCRTMQMSSSFFAPAIE
jgi:hypothetical protein